MAKIGIICDDYKQQMFEQELKAANIVYTVEGNITKGTLVITCYSEQYLVKPVVDKVTQHFLNKYKKGN